MTSFTCKEPGISSKDSSFSFFDTFKKNSKQGVCCKNKAVGGFKRTPDAWMGESIFPSYPVCYNQLKLPETSW